jgi:hypothetical protein
MHNKIALFVSKIDRQHIQLILAVAALAMLVLGIGAPSSGSGGSPH